MSTYRLQQIPTFSRQAKRLLKKYVSFNDDLRALAASLMATPQQGTPLGKDCYKIRLALTSKNRGKSGGARVVTCVKVVGETVYLLTVFDKADRENLAEGELDVLLAEAGLVGE
ncbi:MAG: type II toxin-antitoxin system RelE/ParE family toxin [Hymenobacteraceae bacterium]|nr:type II toxin-antitoxin system RelE/ParE family toxin [Hymenobacteraceae bacterium]